VASLARERTQLLAKANRTPEEDRRLETITFEIVRANDAFRVFLDELSKERPEQVDALREFTGVMATLREIGNGTVALYTILSEDKYSVVMVTSSVRIARQYSIKAADLNRMIVAFRQALKDPRVDPRPLGQELYKILVSPIASDLEAAGAQTLMWSLDGSLRYLPMGALYDGKRYLVERYRNTVFTPASLITLRDEPGPTASMRVLGLGVSKPTAEFNALPGVARELREIIKQSETAGLSRGRLLLNEDFTAANLQSALRERYSIVHIASLFQFRPNEPSDSFLLLGDGSRITVGQLQAFPNIFYGVELLVLSACDTALSGDSNGREVEGFAIVAQRQGAKAVMATLWPMDDATNVKLMSTFFKRLLKGNSKAEALRQAQLELLSQPSSSHPYYWAPYVLIGNSK